MREGLHKIVSLEETIVAIATPLGHGGIGVVRMSGRLCRAIASRCFTHKAEPLLEHRRAMVGIWRDLDGNPVDEVVATLFAGPHSYTGQDVLEVSGHGNPLVLRNIVATAISLGARLASPGEFTLRAVANGKFDLVQAEAVRDFVDAQTDQQAKTALRQMTGSLSNRVRPIKSSLIDLIARLEAGIDFAEDEIEIPTTNVVAEALHSLRNQLQPLLDSFTYGKILIDGIKVAIIGKPNVGKSSIFNRLVGTERAIVTDIPGTTRDVVTEGIELSGVRFSIADTAGIRESVDPVERIGVSRTIETIADADLVLVVLDGSRSLDDHDYETLERAVAKPHVVVVNKNDLPARLDDAKLNGAKRVSISASTGNGLEDLYAELRAYLLSQRVCLTDDLVLTNVRQHHAIVSAVGALAAAEQASLNTIPDEMVLLDLYRALGSLDELTGDVVTDDILDRIFSTFCIGK
jgi:tRNA modification GTPase